MSLISSALFKTDGQEELLTKDAYSITDSLPINKLFEAAKGAGKGIFDAITSKVGLVNGINTLISMKQNGTLDGKAILEKGLSLMGTSTTSVFKDAGQSVFTAAGNFAGASPETLTKMKVMANDATRYITGTDTNKISGLLNVMDVLGVDSGLVKSVNVGVQSSLWGGVISEAINTGIPEMIGVVKKTVDPDVYSQALAWASGTSATKGDVGSFNTIVGEIGGQKVMANMPTFVPTFLGNLTLPEGMGKAEMPALAQTTYTNLLATDPTAIKSSRAGSAGDIFNLSTFSKMSDGAKELFSTLPELKDVVQVASNFPGTTVSDAITKYYPYSVAAKVTA